MKQHLNITNLKILTILIGLISTLILLESLVYSGILKITSDQIRISHDVETIIYCWSPYFFFKVLENKLENLFEKIGLTLNEDDK